MIILKEDAMSSLQLFLLLFSVTVRYRTSVYISILFHKNLHTANTTQQTKLGIVYLIFIPSPIIGLTELFSIFISILFKFENSSREIDTAKFYLNPCKSKETMKTFHFFSCRNIKITIMTLYFQIRDDFVEFF